MVKINESAIEKFAIELLESQAASVSIPFLRFRQRHTVEVILSGEK